MLHDGVNERRRQPKTEPRAHPHERDRELKKETEKGEARVVEGNTEKNILMRSKGSKFGEALLITKRSGKVEKTYQKKNQ